MEKLIFDYEIDRYWEYLNIGFGILILALSFYLLRNLEQGMKIVSLWKRSENRGAMYSIVPVLILFFGAYLVVGIPLGIYWKQHQWEESIRKNPCVEKERKLVLSEMPNSGRGRSDFFVFKKEVFELPGFPGPQYFQVRGRILEGQSILFTPCNGKIVKVWE